MPSCHPSLGHQLTQPLASTAGYYTSLTDLTTLGRSILNSTLLPPLTTRKWLKPVTHTSSVRFSLGSPWEILRESVDVTTTTTTTRVVDFYTKKGGGDGYTSMLGLSPDHGLGVSILTAGPSSDATFLALRQLFVDVWLPAAEQAARDQASANLAGRYALGASSNATVAEVALLPVEPALALAALVSNGTDVLELVRANSKQLAGGQGPVRMWLYPMGLVAPSGGGKSKRIAFRGVVGFAGKPAAEDCGSWAEGDRLRWGNYPVDLVVFETGPDGKATAVEVPILGATLQRVREQVVG